MIFLYTHSHVINYMEPNPSLQANSRSASQEMHRPLLTPTVYYHIYNSQPLRRIMNQMNPVRTLTPFSYFFKIHFNINLPSSLRSPK
jgi:hypothetical protein